MIKRAGWLVALLWTVVIFLGAGWHILEIYRSTKESARIQALYSFQKDVIYRSWAAGHGGVYVSITEKTQPNPYLSHFKDRDVTNTTGLELTLINPSYMTRQVHEIGEDLIGHKSHITSLNPIRPENAPDEWESHALKLLEHGEIEVVKVEKINKKDYLRLMRPLITEESCLKCHAKQGYNVGDIRGGISVSIPMEPLYKLMFKNITFNMIGYGFIWLLGLSGVGFGFSRIGRHIRERDLAEKEILKLKEGLEIEVTKKTKELNEKISDLQRLFDATVERELRMKELYDENINLKTGQKEKDKTP